MKKSLLISSAAILSIHFANPAFAGDPAWIQGSGKSCPQVCNDNNLFPVAAGKYTNGNKFYACAGNANGEGFRTGYNLSPTWSTSCIVGWGGKEVFENSYYCLCHDKNISID